MRGAYPTMPSQPVPLLTPAPTPTPLTTPVAPRGGQSRAAIAAGLVVLALILGGGAFYLSRPPRQPAPVRAHQPAPRQPRHRRMSAVQNAVTGALNAYQAANYAEALRLAESVLIKRAEPRRGTPHRRPLAGNHWNDRARAAGGADIVSGRTLRRCGGGGGQRLERGTGKCRGQENHGRQHVALARTCRGRGTQSRDPGASGSRRRRRSNSCRERIRDRRGCRTRSGPTAEGRTGRGRDVEVLRNRRPVPQRRGCSANGRGARPPACHGAPTGGPGRAHAAAGAGTRSRSRARLSPRSLSHRSRSRPQLRLCPSRRHRRRLPRLHQRSPRPTPPADRGAAGGTVTETWRYARCSRATSWPSRAAAWKP